MADYSEREFVCGDCIHADVCEEAETLVGFSRDNIAYCGMFLNAADVAPVRHGRWYWAKDGHCKCSVCEQYATVKRLVVKTNYCPNCGALMDLEGGNT